MILLLFLIQTTDATTDVAWSSFTSLKLTLMDARRKNHEIVSKLTGAGAIAYLIRALQTLVNEGSDPKNICQTMLVLGQLFFGTSAHKCEIDTVAYVSTLLKLYTNFDNIYRDCNNEIPRFNGEWLYNTTIYYLVVIFHDTITTHPTCLMVVALRRTTLSGNGIEGCSGLHLSPSSDISESVFCIASGLYAKSQFDWEQETIQTRSKALSAARSLYMGAYTPKHSLSWMHRGFRFLPCPLLQSYFPPF